VGIWEDSGGKEDSRLGEDSRASWGVDRLHEGASRQDRTAHHEGACMCQVGAVDNRLGSTLQEAHIVRQHEWQQPWSIPTVAENQETNHLRHL
jgi:hypothetical protein